jgi:hypothetical protein
MPVECHLERTEGTIDGVAGCYLALGDQRFYAPVGVAYRGIATRAKSETNKEVYEISMKDEDGFLVRKLYLPEL